MPDLTSKQRAHLRGLAHGIKPTVHIGKDGVTDAAVSNLQQTFGGSELVKVRVLESAPESAKQTAHALAAAVIDTAVVQVTGRTVVLYRPDPDTPQVRLPR